MSDVYPADVAVRAQPYIDWRAVIAGAILAAGVSFTLLAFGSGIGLAVSSTAPTWRDSTPWLWLLSGIYLIFIALCAFGIGGYAAGRMRLALRATVSPESAFRDGMHGLFMWGLAILITAVLALVAAAIAAKPAVPSGGTAGPASSIAGENILANELDELFRSYRYGPAPETLRAEAARILLKSSSNKGISQDERTYLSNVVALRAGVNSAEADNRVNRVIGESKDELRRARSAAVMEAFLAAAALFLGAAVAWFSAEEGGRDRELGRIPVWDWRFRRPR
ncbi:MAG TPA: hypothetical protein VHT03_10635 [Rhizomicrobium sp.]|jgi:hypothetical protein|nr:hypothetical protein [Rhizomicrobium sp.]